MPQPPVREKSPALDRRADSASEHEGLGIRHVNDLVNTDPSVCLRVPVGEGQPRSPAPVAPTDERRVTRLDADGQGVACLDLQPLSTPNAGPVRRPPILEELVDVPDRAAEDIWNAVLIPLFTVEVSGSLRQSPSTS
jgi:hypothetical protein